MKRRNNITECLGRISRTIEKHRKSCKEAAENSTGCNQVSLRGKLSAYVQCKNIVDSFLKREEDKPLPPGKKVTRP